VFLLGLTGALRVSLNPGQHRTSPSNPYEPMTQPLQPALRLRMSLASSDEARLTPLS
jgi:hypothetical protein